MNILFIGAHPDDCEVYGGGTAAHFSKLGHRVKFISVTNGDAGHHVMMGNELVDCRSKESIIASQVLGVSYEIMDNHDGLLEADLRNRSQIIRRIREWEADIVITHRPNDYHPDHRYTSQLVQDAAYMVMVPNIVQSVAPLRKNPLFLYFQDHFQKPYPFRPDIAVSIDETYEHKIRSLDAHSSQFYEWLPWIDGVLDQVPADQEGRINWLKGLWKNHPSDEVKKVLAHWYGAEHASNVQRAEAFEICEYGRKVSEEDIKELFPMLKNSKL
ncbi:PIG-L deacetylase family protein [Catalinimonas niigatensis]|uniref:PIG-L deacetylase family protein n=1 Tax=Catalinimonas niigatensis TaxID=1397264 RepID=UPI002665A240|nr:PIG-L family deacetylase [Catalinimonas niigatensis]WPP52432.1 PIG-L family deacetylase [Catalinimonas niigatensis]